MKPKSRRCLRRSSSYPRRVFLALAGLCLPCLIFSAARAEEPPRVFILDPQALLAARERTRAGDASLAPPIRNLTRDADRALRAGADSVVNKTLVPPSGDRHDYMSLAPYWWPNPNTANGLPYVRRDGEINPERDATSDRKRLANLVQNLETLALAYFFTGREEYAAQGTQLLRVWFLDDATKMNPNLRYAQAVPGRNSGRGAGIVETHNLPELIDGVGLLAGSQSWSATAQAALQKWFAAYLRWLRESPEGRAETAAQNNHGSWYDVQIAAYALFTGESRIAKEVLSEFASKRVAKQIEPTGRQPRELERAQAWSYSIFNLEALFDAASIAEKLQVDLWNYRTADGRGIRKALDWLLPFAVGEKKWNYREISGWEPKKLAPLLGRAGRHYREPSYEAVRRKLAGPSADGRGPLLYAAPENYSEPKKPAD